MEIIGAPSQQPRQPEQSVPGPAVQLEPKQKKAKTVDDEVYVNQSVIVQPSMKAVGHGGEGGSNAPPSHYQGQMKGGPKGPKKSVQNDPPTPQVSQEEVYIHSDWKWEQKTGLQETEPNPRLFWASPSMEQNPAFVKGGRKRWGRGEKAGQGASTYPGNPDARRETSRRKRFCN